VQDGSARHPNAPAGETQLARFLRRERITVVFLADASRVSRRYLDGLCAGRNEPTRGMMLRIARAISYTIGRRVEVAELFDLELELEEWLLT
jgi:plasmid maintenance system antidote protein VapI